MIAALSFNRPAMNASGVFPVPASYGVSIGGERLYDAWGGVRAGQSHGYPNHRYCANLGHMADDETSLIYMRARYYEPSTGRSISEDPAMDGRNWYAYAWNNPLSFVGGSGFAAEEGDAWLTTAGQNVTAGYVIRSALAFATATMRSAGKFKWALNLAIMSVTTYFGALVSASGLAPLPAIFTTAVIGVLTTALVMMPKGSSKKVFTSGVLFALLCAILAALCAIDVGDGIER